MQQTTLSDALWQGENRLLRNVTLAILGSLALWISAKIQVPFFPVPMTMQIFAILVIGMAYGSKLALATLLLYMAQGAAGLPVFAGTPEKGIGYLYMMGPTGGYLLGFVLASFVVGKLAERGFDRSFATTLLAMVIGVAIIYVPGILWLGTLVGWDKPVLEWGLYPFLPAEAFKIALATAVLPLAWKAVKRDA
ncbi:MAG: biotin transporter BioY [Pseudomonadota bacterium]